MGHIEAQKDLVFACRDGVQKICKPFQRKYFLKDKLYSTKIISQHNKNFQDIPFNFDSRFFSCSLLFEESVEWIQILLKHYDVNPKYIISPNIKLAYALALEVGLGCQKNTSKAIYYLLQLITDCHKSEHNTPDDAEIYHNLAEIYLSKMDIKNAIVYFDKAAELENIDSMYFMGWIHLSGKFTDFGYNRNLLLCNVYFNKCILKKHLGAQRNIIQFNNKDAIEFSPYLYQQEFKFHLSEKCEHYYILVVQQRKLNFEENCRAIKKSIDFKKLVTSINNNHFDPEDEQVLRRKFFYINMSEKCECITNGFI